MTFNMMSLWLRSAYQMAKPHRLVKLAIQQDLVLQVRHINVVRPQIVQDGISIL